VEASDTGYWIGFPLPPRPRVADEPWRPILWSLTLAAVLFLAAFGFARYLARPLRELNAAVERVGRGESPPPLPESGPSEIASLNRAVNGMAANLRQLEQDRALLLAGVSHDLRTPLARLRLGAEMKTRDEATLAGMVADIEEMDRIIGQFLEFARTDRDTALEPCDVVALVAACVDRYARAGRDVRYVAQPLPPVPLRPTAYSRLVNNLIDNALAYGAPPVEVTTTIADGKLVLDVADRGPGSPRRMSSD
jgi:two-component system osmolarity sensor histidine kinase EnvZ